MSDLTRRFQQRHLLAHTGGIVDQDYITRSGDSSYAVGQRIVVRENAVRELLTILRKLTDGMSQSCP
jgi:plasmid maintenance system antidote protein VapI